MKRDPAKQNLWTRNLSRGEMLGLMGSTAAAVALAGCSVSGQSSSEETTSASTAESTTATVAQTAPSCVVRPQQTEGPYFVDERLNRSDIRTEPSDGSVKEGVPLDLTFNVSRSDSTSSCTPWPVPEPGPPLHAQPNPSGCLFASSLWAAFKIDFAYPRTYSL